MLIRDHFTHIEIDYIVDCALVGVDKSSTQMVGYLSINARSIVVTFVPKPLPQVLD